MSGAVATGYRSGRKHTVSNTTKLIFYKIDVTLIVLQNADDVNQKQLFYNEKYHTYVQG